MSWASDMSRECKNHLGCLLDILPSAGGHPPRFQTSVREQMNFSSTKFGTAEAGAKSLLSGLKLLLADGVRSVVGSDCGGAAY